MYSVYAPDVQNRGPPPLSNLTYTDIPGTTKCGECITAYVTMTIGTDELSLLIQGFVLMSTRFTASVVAASTPYESTADRHAMFGVSRWSLVGFR